MRKITERWGRKSKQGHFYVCTYNWLMKNETHSHTTIFTAMSPTQSKIICSTNVAPLNNSKGCSGSCEQKYCSLSLSLVTFLLKDTSAKYCFNGASRQMCKQKRLYNISHSCEHLLEGTAALANTESTLCTNARRSMQISYGGEDPRKTRQQSLSRKHFTADLHQRCNKTKANLYEARWPRKGLWPVTRVDGSNAANNHAVPKDLPTVCLWYATLVCRNYSYVLK